MPSIVLNNVKYSGLSVGKNVVVSKIEPIIGGNRVTFSYTLDSGISESQSLEIMDGEKGVSITDATIEDGNLLVLSLSDGTSIEAGKITVDSSSLDLSNYYTIDEINEKFVTKEEVEGIVIDTLDDSIASSDDIHNLFI